MTHVKICGLRSLADIEAANRYRPDYVGFVFAKSKRQIDADTAATLRAHLAPQIKAVGVFVNQDAEFILSLCERGVIDCIQLHGDECAAYAKDLKERSGCKLIRSFSVKGDTLGDLPDYADYILFDTACGKQRGGSGKAFDWSLLEGIKGDYFLAGGLSPENAGEAVARLHPYCVDVSSGVETDGVKDPEKMRKLIMNLRESL